MPNGPSHRAFPRLYFQGYTSLPRVHVQSREGCVLMTKNLIKWASEHDQFTKLRLKFDALAK